MPYIDQKERQHLDPAMDGLGELLNSFTNNDELSGVLNYTFFRLAKILCTPNPKFPKLGGEKTYARMAVVSSALSEARAEFQRRILVPYEDEKIKINGDVKGYPCNGFGDLQSPYEPKRLTKSDRERFGR